MSHPSLKLRGWVWMAMFTLASCSQLTLKQGEINQALYQGNAQMAYDIMNKDVKRWEKNRNALLYYWNKGTFAWMLGKYEESSELFMTSDYFLEDIYKNYANIAASFFTNDKVKQYTGEDHERIIFQYYQILNFMEMGNLENALVQARRLQLELHRLDDRYKDIEGSKNKRYQEDAFAYVLIGLVYEAARDESNAYIAYKNAYRIYSESYQNNFGMQMPEQFLKDLMRLAYRNGYDYDLEKYESETGVKFDKSWLRDEGNTVIFWNNGLSPVKEEIAINFTIIHGSNPGWVTFTNAQYGFVFPVFVGTDNTKKGSAFSHVEFVKVAFPKYFDRGAYYNEGTLYNENIGHPMSLAEDVSAIAQKVLQDRFLREIGKALARTAMKKASEYQMRKENPEAGAALGLVNLITEQADTRSWESMPHQISYTRLKLAKGSHTLLLQTKAGSVVQDNYVQVEVPTVGMVFKGFHTLQPQQIIR